MENKNKSALYLTCFFISVCLLVGVDQLTKFWAVEYLKGSSDLVLIPGVFSLTYLENRGAAFGLLENKQWFFILGALVMIALTAYTVIRMPKERRYFWLFLDMLAIMAGAFGNLIDRILHQYVIDFFYFSLIDFPVFNVADIYVTIGAIVFVLLYLFLPEENFTFLWRKKEK